MNTSTLFDTAPSKDRYASCKIIRSSERDIWTYYLKNARAIDFYHTLDYHLMDEQGSPLMFVYEEEGLFIAFPMIKRPIDGSDYFDCTGVYGYTGPISNVDFAEISVTTIFSFESALTEFLKSESIVSVFCVLHPLLGQQAILKHTNALVDIGKTIAVNLQQSLDAQRQQYRRPIRMKVNQLRRKGFEVRLADSKEQLATFAEIYRENMIKVGAAKKYLFEDSYFEAFMNAKDFVPELLLAYHNDEPVAGAMVALTHNIVQLHLAGTRVAYFCDSPMKLIFDEACLLGRSRELHYMHLGSGVSGAEDSLFHFKRGFSEDLHPFTTWRYIADKEVYNKLVLEKLDGREMPEVNLFPLYRFI